MMNMFNVINISLKSLFYCLLAILLRREFILLFLMPDMPIPLFLKAFEFMQMNYIWTIVPIIPLYCYFIIKNKKLSKQVYEALMQVIKIADLLIIYCYLHVRLSYV